MKVLVIEDDLALADVLAFTLRRAGFETVMAHDGLEGLERWKDEAPDLIILDLNLPKLDGMGVCRRISNEDGTPIVILSVRSDDEDVVMGLALGADDYVVKPFSPRQLVARVEAVMRRASSQVIAPGPVEAGEFMLDPLRHRMWRSDELVALLTPLETRLLEVLMRNSDQVIPADLLIDNVWGPAGGDKVMLKQLIYRLRHKIASGAPWGCLETVAGVGYSFVSNAPALRPLESTV
jgi:DNA-binding response OmpR family regulator